MNHEILKERRYSDPHHENGKWPTCALEEQLRYWSCFSVILPLVLQAAETRESEDLFLECQCGSDRNKCWRVRSRIFYMHKLHLAFVIQLQHHLSVCVFIVLVCSGVVILLYEPEIFLSLPFQHQLSAFLVGWQVALKVPLERLRYRKKLPFFD